MLYLVPDGSPNTYELLLCMLIKSSRCILPKEAVASCLYARPRIACGLFFIHGAYVCTFFLLDCYIAHVICCYMSYVSIHRAVTWYQRSFFFGGGRVGVMKKVWIAVSSA